MTIFKKKRDATQKDKINKHMDVSGRGETMVQAMLGLPHKIRVLISKGLGQDELVVGLEDLKDLGILHREFPKTLPEKGEKLSDRYTLLPSYDYDISRRLQKVSLQYSGSTSLHLLDVHI